MVIAVPRAFSYMDSKEKACFILLGILQRRFASIKRELADKRQERDQFEDPAYWTKRLAEERELFGPDEDEPPESSDVVEHTNANIKAMAEVRYVHEAVGDMLLDQARDIMKVTELIGSDSHFEIASILRENVANFKADYEVQESQPGGMLPRHKAVHSADIQLYESLIQVLEA